MDIIGLFAWLSARKEMLGVEILPLVRSSTLRQLLYLTTVGQLKGVRYAWRASSSSLWASGQRRVAMRKMASVVGDVLCLRAGEVHIVRHHLRTSHEERGAMADPPLQVAEWFPGQGDSWGDHQAMRDRAVNARKREVWSHPDAPPALVAEAERLMDRYDALAVGDPLPEDKDRMAAGRPDAAEHEINAQLNRVEMEVINAIAATRGRRDGARELSDHIVGPSKGQCQ